MLFFDIECDEDQMRRWVKAVIDNYEENLHRHGSYQTAIEATQETAVQFMENHAQAVEELIEHTGTMH